MKKYTDHYSNRARGPIDQSKRLPGEQGERQTKNSAGGYSFKIDDWSALSRFLVLGSEGGSYYASEQKLTKENAQTILRCLKADGKKTVDTIVSVSQGGRAPKNDPAIFALALAASEGDTATRSYALAEMPKVARIGTHLFQFVEALRSLRGWSKAVSRGVNRWYEEKDAKNLAYQLTKYQSREGWSHKDIFRLSHIKSKDADHQDLYRWVVKGKEALDVIRDSESIAYMRAFEQAKSADESEIIRLVEQFKLPWECIPTDKRSAKVWEALLHSNALGLTALLRNLGNLSANGVLRAGAWDNIQLVRERLTDAEQLKKARIHPLSVLVALNTYGRGAGVRGKNTWSVVQDIRDALDDAFYLAFDAIVPANKRFLLGIDVSGSMSWGEIAGMPGITPRIGSAAMAMVTHRTEPKCLPMAFSHQLVPVELSKKEKLESVVNKFSRIPMGGTDCALPMIYATKNNIDVDAFVVYTDSETWYNSGSGHPVQALKAYRDKTGINAKLIVVGMVASKFSIADPADGNSLDVVGFDTAAPRVMRDFVAEDF